MRVCVVWYNRLFGILRGNALGAYDITYAGHYEKSLYCTLIMTRVENNLLGLDHTFTQVINVI